MNLFLLAVISTTYVSVSFANTDYGKLRIYGGSSNHGRLEFKQRDGQWGTVCNKGFNSYAASVACKQLGYLNGYQDSSSSHIDYSTPIAICHTYCDGDERRLADCSIQNCDHDYNSCTHDDDVIINCYGTNNNNNNDDNSEGGSSSGAVIGSVLAGVFIAAIVIFLVICRVFIRYSYIRRNQNRTVIVTQRRTPRILIARVTRTVSSGPPPPPAYTLTAPRPEYTPVPPRGYQPVPTTDYTAANNASDNTPSDPPPEYTPAANAPMPVSEGSAQ